LQSFNQKKFFALGLFTLFGFGGIGLAILYFAEGVLPLDFFMAGKIWWQQLLSGLVFGTSAAVCALLMVNSKWFTLEMEIFSELILKLAPNYAYAVFYSFCAGVGEELLFRGGLQPYLGIWLTSIIFIGLHGYLNPYNWALTVYGLFMVLISSGMGYLFNIYGIGASITAHFIFDLIMFIAVIRGKG
jgi:membrane protease YdiL (CAAX protease family)